MNGLSLAGSFYTSILLDLDLLRYKIWIISVRAATRRSTKLMRRRRFASTADVLPLAFVIMMMIGVVGFFLLQLILPLASASGSVPFFELWVFVFFDTRHINIITQTAAMCNGAIIDASNKLSSNLAST